MQWLRGDGYQNVDHLLRVQSLNRNSVHFHQFVSGIKQTWAAGNTKQRRGQRYWRRQRHLSQSSVTKPLTQAGSYSEILMLLVIEQSSYPSLHHRQSAGGLHFLLPRQP